MHEGTLDIVSTYEAQSGNNFKTTNMEMNEKLSSDSPEFTCTLTRMAPKTKAAQTAVARKAQKTKVSQNKKTNSSSGDPPKKPRPRPTLKKRMESAMHHSLTSTLTVLQKSTININADVEDDHSENDNNGDDGECGSNDGEHDDGNHEGGGSGDGMGGVQGEYEDHTDSFEQGTTRTSSPDIVELDDYRSESAKQKDNISHSK